MIFVALIENVRYQARAKNVRVRSQRRSTEIRYKLGLDAGVRI